MSFSLAKEKALHAAPPVRHGIIKPELDRVKSIRSILTAF